MSIGFMDLLFSIVIIVKFFFIWMMLLIPRFLFKIFRFARSQKNTSQHTKAEI